MEPEENERYSFNCENLPFMNYLETAVSCVSVLVNKMTFGLVWFGLVRFGSVWFGSVPAVTKITSSNERD